MKLRREEGRYLKVKNRFHDFIAAARCSASYHFPARSCSQLSMLHAFVPVCVLDLMLLPWPANIGLTSDSKV